MSVQAITWAIAQKLDRSSAKFVLVAMANCSHDGATFYGSMQYLCNATCQDRKTVIENIKRLKDAGFISDSGGRKGKTGQVAVYVLNRTENGTLEDPKKRNGAENGTVPITDAKGPNFPIKESRFSLESVPKSGHGDVRETLEANVGKEKSERETLRVAPTFFADVDPEILADWRVVRKAKNAGAITATVERQLRREAEKAGMTAEQAIEMCCLRAWQGFKAEWVSKPFAQGGGAAAESFKERNERFAAERAYEATGGKLGQRPIGREESIEVTNRRVGGEWLKLEGAKDAVVDALG